MMSRTDMPCAYRLMIVSSRPPATRPARLGTSTGPRRAGPVPRHPQRHRPHPGLHCLGDAPVPGVPRPAAGPLARLITQMSGQLRRQRPLQHRRHQLAQHRPLAGQPQPARLVPRPFQQRVQQPVIHQLPQRHLRRRAARARHRPVTALLTDLTIVPPTSPGGIRADRPRVSGPLPLSTRVLPADPEGKGECAVTRREPGTGAAGTRAA